MNERFAASSELCRDGSLPGDLHDFLHNKIGLRPTRQRIAIARLLLRDRNRRVTAEILYDEAREARCHVSRSAVCSALRQFEQAGLLRRIAIDRSKQSWFVIANASVDLS
jgi:Fur family transcriptional regulator, iron response regulator